MVLVLTMMIERTTMNPEEIHSRLGNTPYMTLAQGKRITDLIQRERAKNVLELGFAHGVSTAYIANAVGENGRVLTIDLHWAQSRVPNIFTTLSSLGLRDRVEVAIEPLCYSWYLMWLIEQGHPKFDFVYLDGGHTWLSTGFAFFLCDKLLKVGGLMLFDDYEWSIALSPDQDESQKDLPQDYKETKQVKKVFDLLVMQHPAYADFKVENGWAMARKFA